MDYTQYLKEQQSYFRSGATKELAFRLQSLQRLLEAIKRYEPDLFTALKKDLGKSEYEAYLTEIGMVKEEIRHTMKHLKKWMKPARVGNPLSLLGAKSYIYPEPLGVSLIIAPWNYPVQLQLAPLIGAISAGNCAILKPSELTPHVSQVIAQMIEGIYSPKYIRVIQGGVETSQALLELPVDHIFFTGSVAVGKIVMEAAAKNLTPVTLELGGKSPAIVDNDANLSLAARRLVWGKFMNAGQTCVAPDYLMVHEDVKKELILQMQKAIFEIYGEQPLQAENYGKLVSKRHFDRLVEFLKDGEVLMGGEVDEEHRKISPTLLDEVDWKASVMKEEIFGPILPIFTYSNLQECIEKIWEHPKPLALYVFTESKEKVKKVLDSVSFGGGCINDTVVHLSNPHLPFGGVQHSGHGSYHGKYSFDCFSHAKSIVKQTTKFDVSIRYPLKKNKLSLLKKIFR